MIFKAILLSFSVLHMKLLECKPKLNKWMVQGVLNMADNQGNLANRTQASPRQQMEVPDKGYVKYGLSSTNICQLRSFDL